MRHARRPATISFVVALLIFTLPAGVIHADPSPYCRPVVSAPYAYSGPVLERTGIYGFGVEGGASLHCDGPIDSGAITSILYYSTDGLAGAQRGSSISCHGSCDAAAYYHRHGLHCGEYYFYDDYAQITGWWRKTPSSDKVTVSQGGPRTKGSSHFPSVCR